MTREKELAIRHAMIFLTDEADILESKAERLELESYKSQLGRRNEAAAFRIAAAELEKILNTEPKKTKQ